MTTTAGCHLVIDGMHCASCGLLVDETVEELDAERQSLRAQR